MPNMGQAEKGHLELLDGHLASEGGQRNMNNLYQCVQISLGQHPMKFWIQLTACEKECSLQIQDHSPVQKKNSLERKIQFDFGEHMSNCQNSSISYHKLRTKRFREMPSFCGGNAFVLWSPCTNLEPTFPPQAQCPQRVGFYQLDAAGSGVSFKTHFFLKNGTTTLSFIHVPMSRNRPCQSVESKGKAKRTDLHL